MIMKKKLIALLVCLTMAMIPVLASCGGGSSSGGGSDEGEFKVALICLHDENSTYDLNFINGFKEAMGNLGIDEDHYMIKTGVPEGQECYDAAAELADAGCKLIFSDSFGHQDYMLQAATEFPDVQFVSCTGDKALVANQDNYHNAFAAIYDGRYLAGVAAGMKLNELKEAGKLKGDTPKMGYVGAFTYAEVISGYTSFYLGAKSVCPDVTMDVTFTGSWYDETAEKEGANKLIQGGCDLISQHADSFGAPTACETAGVPNVSYNGSTKEAGPNTYIISSKINWSPFFEYAAKAVQNGEAFDTNWTGTIDTGSVELTELNTDVAAEGTAEKLEEVKAALVAGNTHVFDTSTFTVEGKTLDSYKADVEADDKYEHETEVVSDGYFHESEFRSAPYFDIQIDGINLLDTNFG
ncbi:MAG: BMP family ABC transporter substrate-binding protein [Mogibacterium sp.]|nr:BMP family ABC transporter substrate-binding protein [Mogibacterium sp.]